MNKISVPETPDIQIAWKWFQDEENLKRIKAEKRAVWQDAGIDNRYAHAALIACILPDFTRFVLQERESVCASEDVQRLLQKRFAAIMNDFSEPEELYAIEFEQKCLKKVSLFLYELLGLWRFLWNKQVKRDMQKDKHCRLSLISTAFQICDNNPIKNQDREKSGKQLFKKDRKNY